PVAGTIRVGRPPGPRGAAGNQPVGQNDPTGRARGDRLKNQAVVVAVVTRVVGVVGAAGRRRVAGVEAWVRPADVGRGDGAVVAADVAADVVVRAAVVEDRGDVVRAHEGQRHERARRSTLTDTAQAVLDRAVAHLARIRPAGVR